MGDRWANDNYGYVLSAQPGQSQGRPATRSEGGRGGPSLSEVAKLRAENDRLRTKLSQAEAIIDVQGKVHALLEEISKSAAPDEQ